MERYAAVRERLSRGEVVILDGGIGSELVRRGVRWRGRLPLTLTMPLRNLLRRPLRTLGTASGVACAVMLMVIAGAFSISAAIIARDAPSTTSRVRAGSPLSSWEGSSSSISR